MNDWNNSKELHASFFHEGDAWRLWEWADISGGDKACWPWKAFVSPKGYGIFRVYRNGKKIVVLAHRAALALTVGVVPAGMLVCHRCDNPGCINPAHLWLGTNEQNLIDMRDKGRNSRGEKVVFSKLNREQALSIFSDMRTQRVIAMDYGVSQSSVSRIKTGIDWGWFTRVAP